MAKVITLMLVVIMVVVALVQVECVADDKEMSSMRSDFKKALDAVIEAAPPEKKSEVEDATGKQSSILDAALAKANGDDLKVARIILAYKFASGIVTLCSPKDRFKAMEEVFKDASTAGDKDKSSNFKKAIDDVIATAPPEKKAEAEEAAKKQSAIFDATLAKAKGDGKKIAMIEFSYMFAADLVLATSPADKLETMEKAFAHAAEAGDSPA